MLAAIDTHAISLISKFLFGYKTILLFCIQIKNIIYDSTNGSTINRRMTIEKSKRRGVIIPTNIFCLLFALPSLLHPSISLFFILAIVTTVAITKSFYFRCCPYHLYACKTEHERIANANQHSLLHSISFSVVVYLARQ